MFHVIEPLRVQSRGICAVYIVGFYEISVDVCPLFDHERGKCQDDASYLMITPQTSSAIERAQRDCIMAQHRSQDHLSASICLVNLSLHGLLKYTEAQAESLCFSDAEACYHVAMTRSHDSEAR